ncbi:MAG: SLATT domain-containing protein [Chloroflexota bacterium]|nr:SLATT domain-containing protein [Chloroflexota bacterium]
MNEILEKAREYWINAGTQGLAHFRAAEVAERRGRQIGVPSVIISAVVATSIFSTLGESIDIRWRIATGAVALLAAVLAALQAFLSYGDRAEKHKAAGANYRSMRLELDVFLLKYSARQQCDHDEALTELERISERLGSLAANSPTLTEKIYVQGRREFVQRHGLDNKT